MRANRLRPRVERLSQTQDGKRPDREGAERPHPGRDGKEPKPVIRQLIEPAQVLDDRDLSTEENRVYGPGPIRRIVDDCHEALHDAPPAQQLSIRKFVDELIWREFYCSVLYHYPSLVHSNYREAFDKMPWKFCERLFKSWKEGKTGYPLVDAGMRQLNQTGWMHNRVRMVVASFLTKDLMHDWRKGAEYFEEKLMDIETSSNSGGWQWAASTGVDPKPLRIFNPRLQSERFDPEGDYIKRFVPELRKVPMKFIHAPHALPPALQKELGCVIGKHYPVPIVDHATASNEYKRLFAAIKSRESLKR